MWLIIPMKKHLIFGCQWLKCPEEPSRTWRWLTFKYVSSPWLFSLLCNLNLCLRIGTATSHLLTMTAKGGGCSAGKKMSQRWWRQECCHMQQWLIIGHDLALSPPKIYKNVNEHEVAWWWQRNLKQRWKPFNRLVQQSTPLLELV